MKLDEILALFEAKPAGRDNWIAPCPAHEDERPSLSIGLRRAKDGVLVHCFTGCTPESICEAKGISVSDLFFNPRPGSFHASRARGAPSSAAGAKAPPRPASDGHGSGAGTRAKAGNGPRSVEPVTVAALAAKKLLSAEFLHALGVEDLPGGGIGISYHGHDGGFLLKRERGTRGKRFHQPSGVKLKPYGRDRLAEARGRGELWLVEGESDAWTLWHHGIPALGLPGAAAAKALEAEDLAGISTLYIHQEPDKAGATFVRGVAERLRALGWNGVALAVRLDGEKDPADLHIQVGGDRGRFLAALEEALATAESLTLEDSGGEGAGASGAASGLTIEEALKGIDAATAAARKGDRGAAEAPRTIEALRALRGHDPGGYEGALKCLVMDCGCSRDRIVALVEGVGPAGAADGAPSAEPIHRTDLGNARRLRLKYGNEVRYCHPWRRWLTWDGRRWEEDTTARVLRLAPEVVGDMLHEAAALDRDEREALAKWALQSESEKRLGAMVGLCESQPGIPVLPGDLDHGTWLLNTPSGTVDLRTGKLHPHRREDLLTKLTGAPFDPKATCPRFEKFVLEIMGGRRHLADFLQRVIGYAVCGNPQERKLFILWGGGKNGKSTLLTIVFEALGDYARKTAAAAFLAKKGDTIPNDIAALKGARLVFAAESAEGRKLDENLVKELTGREPISARFMRGEWFTFLPEFVPLLATNHRPVISGTDEAIWDRISLVPFKVRFEGGREDKGLLEALRDELPGILAWIVRGALEWQRDGLREPEEVAEATSTYREESDRLAEFFVERCIMGGGFRSAASTLHRAYKEWAEGRGEAPLGPNRFGERLRERGLESRKGTGGVRMWLGIALLGPGSGGVADSGTDSRVSSRDRPSRGTHPESGASCATPPLGKDAREPGDEPDEDAGESAGPASEPRPRPAVEDRVAMAASGAPDPTTPEARPGPRISGNTRPDPARAAAAAEEAKVWEQNVEERRRARKEGRP